MDKSLASFSIPLPRILWVFLPICLYLYCFLAKMTGWRWETPDYREYGLIENGTLLFLAVAIVYAIRLCLRVEQPLQKAWFCLLAAGAFYFLGEEASWGQHFFAWHTPDAFTAMNQQKETNLHNMSGPYRLLFDNLPRQALSLASIVGGFVIPAYFLRSGKTFAPNSLHHWIWPSYACGLTGLLATLAGQPIKIAHALHMNLPYALQIDYGELKECLLALFILLYMLGASGYFSQASRIGDRRVSGHGTIIGG